MIIIEYHLETLCMTDSHSSHTNYISTICVCVWIRNWFSLWQSVEIYVIVVYLQRTYNMRMRIYFMHGKFETQIHIWYICFLCMFIVIVHVDFQKSNCLHPYIINFPPGIGHDDDTKGLDLSIRRSFTRCAPFTIYHIGFSFI